MSGEVGAGPLRDAAVNPIRYVDFCAPVCAGTADPHGPNCRAVEVGSAEYQARVDALHAGDLDRAYPQP